MVRTWNREPSPDQDKARRDRSPRHTPTITYHPNNVRFAYDGKIKTPNFLNGYDAQLLEARGQISPANTNTHTRYDFSSTGVGNLSISLAAEMAKSINTCGTMRAGRPKSATARSLVANDTRYEHLKEPHNDHVGPGAYDIERAVPGVGPMALDSHTSSASPQRDPYRPSAPFKAPRRPGSAQWVLPWGPDAVYISPDFVPSPDHAPAWDTISDKRPDASQWRLNHARVIAAVVAGAGTGGGAGAGAAAADAPFSSDLQTDVASRPLEVSLRAQLRNPHKAVFASKEPRLTSLPLERTSDLRYSRLAALRGPDDTAHLGPGSYTPPTSVGGARRSSYRIFVDPLVTPQPSDRFGVAGGRGSVLGGSQSDAAAIVAACERGTARARATAASALQLGSPPASAAAAAAAAGLRALSACSHRSSCGGGSSAPSTPGSRSVGNGVARPGPSAAFAGTFRAHKAGAFDWRTDSALVRY
ncbi:hypothetical protein VOLCADRAFT_87767 [Volvox carteri f. nagariensis]|uniref:Uncharacterized protein n=1 Tax=Volvox carteri f. nagariensis TaxID=3068 RepID=D8TM69_VOLCA|nr:uncharacterized protein VOLCADRAFT_87767 [Volvox carteri f. nagariensis]EFJ51592.1 hypothetical protein VOLCADRAFT_87767 [Volvox carteri f. nagariensis]|eukprot:XP_002947544.1 hypothetical protein VOLCADRAFT_87767 [Volvox carteri f. nagariensis]